MRISERGARGCCDQRATTWVTVRDEGLGGATDKSVFDVCGNERRALITLDHDSGQVLRFPPELSSGVVILELPPRATREALLQRLWELLAVMETRPLADELWTVEPGWVRIHQRKASDEL